MRAGTGKGMIQCKQGITRIEKAVLPCFASGTLTACLLDPLLGQKLVVPLLAIIQQLKSFQYGTHLDWEEV